MIMSKIRRFLTFVAFLCAVLCRCSGYFDEGTWPEFCKIGLKQSPVVLSQQTSEKVHYYDDFVFSGYEKISVQPSIHHDNLYLKVLNRQPSIRGGGLIETYNLDSLHFHWGGSEHTIDGERFPVEIHAVHFAPESLRGSPEFITVIGVVLDIGNEPNLMFQTIIDNVAKSMEKPFDINVLSLLPENNQNEYFRYPGSLTTPDCNETVVWTVFKEPIYVTRKQLKEFNHKFVFKHNLPPKNYRSIQKLNGRVVQWVTSASPTTSSASAKSNIWYSAFRKTALSYMLGNSSITL